MKFFVTFKQQNVDFDKEYAKQYHGGKESNNNPKDNWMYSYKISDTLCEYQVIDSGEYKFTGYRKDKTFFSYEIPNVTIIKCLTDEKEIIEIAVSKTLIDKTHVAKNEKYDTTRFYFYLKPTDEFVRVSEFVYLNVIDFPKEFVLSKFDAND